ncbi:hypothetical protein Pan161_40630 [Gimesia algae]|uniref:Uncharacterized protein n=2 Tax=Gimesia algae TaxID=2527971 RepID=A0A517VHB5_9PLAN|nr:hypothetical protein Pan161_40630 [Gimesia algae]
MISQKNEKTPGPLVASKSSSRFNYFAQKEDKSKEGVLAKVKISGTYPADEFQDPNQMELTSQAAPADQQPETKTAQQRLQKPDKKPVTGISENWRSKSLIASAKRYPAHIAKKFDQNTERVRQASSSISQGIASKIQHISNDEPVDTVTGQDQAQGISPGKTTQRNSNSENTLTSAKEVDRLLAETNQQNLRAELTELAKDLHQDLDQTAPAFEDVNQEMRRLQINSIMDRARRELAQKNYEYAEFLAAQALESSYRGHVAFGLEDESPQMLLEKIKKQISSIPLTEVQRIQHAEPAAKPNSGQMVPNFQFTPSPVHPLRRRAVDQPETRKTQSNIKNGGSDELPLIVPRNMGIQPQKIQIQPRQSAIKQKPPRSGGISLEAPSFDSQPQVKSDVPHVERIEDKNTDTMHSAPALKLELEDVPDEPPAKIKLSGPEAMTEQPVIEENKSTGPQLMLPKLPSVPGDLTSQVKPGRDTAAAPVNFRSKIQGARQEKTLENLQGQNSSGERSQAQTSLTLDEIEWDLEERKSPNRAAGWWGLPTLLMIAGGAIILLLLSIIVILLKRGSSTS